MMSRFFIWFLVVISFSCAKSYDETVNGICNYEQCLQNSYWMNGNCNLCPLTCSTCISASVCTSCNQSYYLSSGQCLACVSNCQTCSSATSCTACSPGYYLDTNNNCLQCSWENCATCPDNNGCSTCLLGFSMDQQSCVRCNYPCETCILYSNCITCLSGFILEGQTCKSCPSNCKVCNSTTFCNHCESGYNTTSTGSCLQCPSTQYFGGCTNCDSNGCTSCYSGWMLDSQQKCSIYCGNCANCSDPGGITVPIHLGFWAGIGIGVGVCLVSLLLIYLIYLLCKKVIQSQKKGISKNMAKDDMELEKSKQTNVSPKIKPDPKQTQNEIFNENANSHSKENLKYDQENKIKKESEVEKKLKSNSGSDNGDALVKLQAEKRKNPRFIDLEASPPTNLEKTSKQAPLTQIQGQVDGTRVSQTEKLSKRIDQGSEQIIPKLNQGSRSQSQKREIDDDLDPVDKVAFPHDERQNPEVSLKSIEKFKTKDETQANYGRNEDNLYQKDASQKIIPKKKTQMKEKLSLKIPSQEEIKEGDIAPDSQAKSQNELENQGRMLKKLSENQSQEEPRIKKSPPKGKSKKNIAKEVPSPDYNEDTTN